MKARMVAGFLGLAAVLASGCTSIVGRWSLAGVDPEAARRDVKYHTLTLQKDGTFYADAKEAPGIRTTSGTYSYRKNILHLQTHDGDHFSYDAKIEGNNLWLENFWQGQKIKMKYEKSASN